MNAANSSLLGGGGVDGAIHRAGGPAILAECRLLRGCDTGDAKATTRRRPARAVRDPHRRAGLARRRPGEEALLASCYRRAVEVADELGCARIAFPAISCGVYGFPVDRAAPIALAESRAAAEASRHVRVLRHVLFGEADLAAFALAAERLERW